MMNFKNTMCVIALCSLSSCTTTQELVGSGKERTESRNVGEVTSIEASGSLLIRLIDAPAKDIKLVGDDNLLYKLSSEMSGSTLRLSTACDDCTLKPKVPFVVEVPKGVVQSIILSRDARLDIKKFEGESLTLTLRDEAKASVEGMTAEELSVKLTGQAEVEVKGKADELEFEGRDSTRFTGKELTLEDADISASDNVKLTVDVRNELEAELDDNAQLTLQREPTKASTKVNDSASIIRAY